MSNDVSPETPETLPAIVRRSLARPRDAVLLERRDGAFAATASGQLLERVENIACALRASGLNAGDRVALIASDRVDWVVADFGTLFAGCVLVPIFPTQATDHVAYILENSAAKLLFVDTPQALERLRGLALPPAVVFAGEGEGSLAAFEARGAALRAADPSLPHAYEALIKPSDLAILIYTSGTTGRPKGVMLSHHNLGFTAKSSCQWAFHDMPEDAPALSVLPFSHIYEHCIIYVHLIARVRHYICHHPDQLLHDLRDVRPHAITVVPRIFERVIAGIIGNALVHGGAQARLVPWALGVGRRFADARTRGERVPLGLRLQYEFAHALVLKKIPARLGLQDLRFFVTGSAPLHFDTAMTLLGMGFTTIEGYGPTECSPVVTVNRLEDNVYGTVGKPIPGVAIKTADDGEILVRGPNVMQGYYQDPGATAAVMDDGWYKTGDVGEIDARGYLRITDRKKELFKTSGGKFVAPARVESAIKRSIYVNQVLLVGDDRPHPAALISPNWDLVRHALQISGSPGDEELAARDDVTAFLRSEVRRQTADLAKYEQVWRIAVLPREMTVESGDLSPAMKVRRRAVEQKYAAQIEQAYAAEAHPKVP